jgi:RNA polymerase sigma-70 factor (ECF subfamily)
MTVRQDQARQASWSGAAPAPSQPSGAPAASNRRHANVDHRDFTAVYEACYSDVARWVRALGGPPSDLADIVQEVFVVVHRRLPDFDGENLIAWLYRITAHQVRDFRRMIWIKHIFRRSVQVSSQVASVNPTQLMVLETREKQRHLEKLLSRLSESLRSTFILFEIEGYTAEEITVMQDLSMNTVRARIQRARKKMTGLLAVEASKGGPGPWSR